MIDQLSDESLRSQAVERLKKKRDFKSNLLAYVMVNGMLIAIWAMTSSGFFWPMFPMFGWGIGLVFHAWDTYGRPPTEERIRREMDYLAGSSKR